MRLDELNYAVQNLLHRRLRSSLSILSILIGIMAIFALVSFGLGMRNYINTLSSEAGVDKLFVQAQSVGAPGTDLTFFLTKEDIDFISRINGVSETAGMYMTPQEIISREQNKFNFLMGLDMDNYDLIAEAFTVKIDKGRELKAGDTDKVVLGYNYQLPNKIFRRPLVVGDKVEIAGKEFTIIGFYKEVGNPSDDANMYITSEEFENTFPEQKDKFQFVMVRAEQDVTTSVLADRIEERFRKHKGQEEGQEDFFVRTFEDALQTFNNILLIINSILVLIALISLVVASVNIMNTMYTAVLERTKEIGIMKSVGARNSDIMFIFIFESGMIGMIGGVLGVAVGYVIAVLGGAIAAGAGFGLLQPIFPWYLTTGCILFSFLIGAAAGVLPARRAAKLRPVDALRYE